MAKQEVKIEVKETKGQKDNWNALKDELINQDGISFTVDKGEIRIWFGGSWNLVLNKSGTWEME